MADKRRHRSASVESKQKLVAVSNVSFVLLEISTGPPIMKQFSKGIFVFFSSHQDSH